MGGLPVPPLTESLTRSLATLGRRLADIALPETCTLCGEWIADRSHAVCPKCWRELQDDIGLPYCRRCGRTSAVVSLDKRGCTRCRHEDYWRVAAMARVAPYTPRMKALATSLKYAGRTRSATLAGRLLADAVRAANWPERPDFLVPVPMHWIRRRQRPCDHARLLAEAVGAQLHIHTASVVRRTRHTPSQVGLGSMAERFRNVQNCFVLRRFSARRVRDSVVCIVDNVVTTGATLHEVAKVLRRAGARQIYAAILARTVLAGDMQGYPLAEAAEGELVRVP